MDVPTNTVIGQHGYCTQELVNLLLTGTASSNVFNGTTQLGSGKDVTVLRGVQAKSEIGLLSLFEHYKSCEVSAWHCAPPDKRDVVLSWFVQYFRDAAGQKTASTRCCCMV